MTEMLDNGTLRSTPLTHLAPSERTRVARWRAGSGSRFAIKFATVSAPKRIVISSTEVVVVSPAGSVGVVDVTTTASSGTSVTSSADQFTYEGAPTVTGMRAPTGIPSGGTPVTNTGTGFTAASGVTFGSTSATGHTVVSATQITHNSPAEAAGTVNVTVVTPSGTSTKNAAAELIYELVPTVSALSPTPRCTTGAPR